MEALLNLLFILFQQIFVDNQHMIGDNFFFHLSLEMYMKLYYTEDRKPTMSYKVFI